MTLRTPICDLFDIEVPVFLAGMGGVAYAEVCAAVSEAGGFGTLGMAGLRPEQIAEQISQGAIVPHVSKIFPLSRTAAAMDLNEKGHTRESL